VPSVPSPPPLNSNPAATAFSLDGKSPRTANEPSGPKPSEVAEEPGPSEVEGARLRDELCEAMAAIHQRGWCDGTGGNFSCVLQRQPLLLLMAPSGVDKGKVKPQELIVVDGDGRVCHGSGRASAETLLHLAIVRETAAGAVLHTHSQAGTLLSQWCWERERKRPALVENHDEDGIAYLEVSDLEMLKGIAGITTHRSAVRIPVLANDQDLGRLSSRAGPNLERAPAGLLIAGHGLYAWGQNLSEARRHLEILEFLLEQRWRQLLLEVLMVRGHGSAPDTEGPRELGR